MKKLRVETGCICIDWGLWARKRWRADRHDGISGLPRVVPYARSLCECRSVMSDSLWSHRLQAARLLCPWNPPDQNTGVGSCSLLQGIFPTQGSNPGLPHCRRILYQLSHKGSPRILYWVAYPYSSRSSQHGNQASVSCIAGRFFTNWAIREVLIWKSKELLLINAMNELCSDHLGDK